jgi:TRAP transporter 4TM/12TM fusion protein
MIMAEISAEIRERIDEETDSTALKGKYVPPKLYRVVRWMALLWVLYHVVYGTGIWIMEDISHRANHLAFVLPLIFILFPFNAKKKSVKTGWTLYIDIFLALVGIGVNLYLTVLYEFFPDVVTARGGQPTQIEMVLGIVTMIVLLEATRRMIRYWIPLLCIVSLIYTYYSNYFPGIFNSRGYEWDRIIANSYTWTEGIYGIPLGVSANYIFLFVVFSLVFARSGVGKMFIDVALGLFGSFRGGAAKVALVSAGLFGMISGSAVANVMVDGSVTIPMMKKMGFSAEMAGGVSSAAGTGGMVMPPVMGAAAFIMADYLGVSYGKIIIAAFLPAFLYYVCLFCTIDLKALELGLKGLPKSELPDWKKAIKEGWHLFFPMILVVYLLVVADMSAAKAVLWGILAMIVMITIRPSSRLSIKTILGILEDGALTALQVAVCCAAVGVFIGCVNLTGIGVHFTSAMVNLAGGQLGLLAIMVAIVALVLGLGLTPSAVYITLAIIAAPALVALGVPPMAAHLFVFYYGCLGDITPPVALSAFAAAAISGGDPMKTSFKAWRFGIAAFILPFMWIYNPSLLCIGSPLLIATTFITGVIGMWALVCALEGYIFTKANVLLRAMMLFGAYYLIIGTGIQDLIGIASVVCAALLSKYVFKATKTLPDNRVV